MAPKKRKPATPPDARPLLLGRLRFPNGSRHIGGLPRIYVWCPFCRKQHDHGFTDSLSTTYSKTAHCETVTPFTATGYHVGLDPADDAESLRVLRQAGLAD